MVTPSKRTEYRNATERRSEEANLCNNGLILLLCGGLRIYESIRTAAVGGENYSLANKYSALLILTSTTLERGFGIWYSSRMILFYCDHLDGRQAVENHLVH